MELEACVFGVFWCTYYKKSKHTKDTCFKLHGNEAILCHIDGFRNLQLRKQANLTEEPKETLDKVATVVSELCELNEDEISKLRSFLKPFNPLLAL